MRAQIEGLLGVLAVIGSAGVAIAAALQGEWYFALPVALLLFLTVRAAGRREVLKL